MLPEFWMFSCLKQNHNLMKIQSHMATKNCLTLHIASYQSFQSSWARIRFKSTKKLLKHDYMSATVISLDQNIRFSHVDNIIPKGKNCCTTLANVVSYILVQTSANTRRRVEATIVPNDTETSLLVVWTKNCLNIKKNKLSTETKYWML